MGVFKEELYGATDFSSNLIRLYSGFSKRFLRAINYSLKTVLHEIHNNLHLAT